MTYKISDIYIDKIVKKNTGNPLLTDKTVELLSNCISDILSELVEGALGNTPFETLVDYEWGTMEELTVPQFLAAELTDLYTGRREPTFMSGYGWNYETYDSMLEYQVCSDIASEIQESLGEDFIRKVIVENSVNGEEFQDMSMDDIMDSDEWFEYIIDPIESFLSVFYDMLRGKTVYRILEDACPEVFSRLEEKPDSESLESVLKTHFENFNHFLEPVIHYTPKYKTPPLTYIPSDELPSADSSVTEALVTQVLQSLNTSAKYYRDLLEEDYQWLHSRPEYVNDLSNFWGIKDDNWARKKNLYHIKGNILQKYATPVAVHLANPRRFEDRRFYLEGKSVEEVQSFLSDYPDARELSEFQSFPKKKRRQLKLELSQEELSECMKAVVGYKYRVPTDYMQFAYYEYDGNGYHCPIGGSMEKYKGLPVVVIGELKNPLKETVKVIPYDYLLLLSKRIISER